MRIFCNISIFLIVVYGSSLALAEDGGRNSIELITGPPDRDVRYMEQKPLPRWKIDWDRARSLYRQGKTGPALIQYELLLQNKGSIDEARWEYATLLMQEKRWKQAGKEVDTLLTRAPGNRKYLLTRARISLEEGYAELAVKQYGQLYDDSPNGNDSTEALVGLLAALEKLDKKEAQLPLLEQLLLRKPGDLSLMKRTGSLALELGKAEKARDLLAKLIDDYPEDTELLRLVAQAEDNLNNRDRAADIWQQLTSLVPEDIQGNKWLTQYYQETGNYELALTHVERQLKANPGIFNLILTAARLHKQIGRPGQALNYYSLYLDLVPGDRVVRAERNNTRERVVADLITQVEHRKLQQLWEDLQQVTGDREEVYHQVADWFRQEGKQKELTDVFLILYQQHPADRNIYGELISLLEDQGRHDEIEKL